jgi:prepilin-type N-terminal cleavage/methylation domain-containing protein
MKTAQKHPPHNQTEPGLVGPGFIPVFTAKFQGGTPRLCSPGFTLIELMISIALVLILILGVNQIFTYTTQAVGAGQAINAAIRDSRAAQAQLSSDFAAMVAPGTFTNDSASLIIASRAVWAFRDKADQAQDLDGFADTRDLNNDHIEGDTKVPGELIAPYSYNLRNHRLDVLSFFARDQFHRQTGNPGYFVDDMSSQEVWVWYGHLWLPDNTGNFTSNTFPGMGTLSQQPNAYPQTAIASSNPNNLYATQFVLGRWATLLREKSSDNSIGSIYDNAGYPQYFINRRAPYPGTSGTLASDLEPLCPFAQAANPQSGVTNENLYLFQDGRFDLAATTISSYRSKLQSYISNTTVAASQTPWWDQMMDGNAYPTPPFSSVYYTTRFKCNPFVSKPMTADTMASASPYMLGGCSQFIVEFAGDYVSQDNNPSSTTYGNVTGNAGDGQVDYVIVPNGNGGTSKQILWYGLPRNTSGKTGVSPANGDVAPLNTWLTGWGFADPYYNPAAGAGFEKMLPFASGSAAASMKAGAQYICAWGPNDKPPSLIRITLTLDDPTGRLPEGQTYQYIFPVPPQ